MVSIAMGVVRAVGVVRANGTVCTQYDFERGRRRARGVIFERDNEANRIETQRDDDRTAPPKAERAAPSSVTIKILR